MPTNTANGKSIKARPAWGALTAALFIALILTVVGCSKDDDNDGPGNTFTPPRPGSIGKTNDGHDVVVYEEGELDDALFKIDTTTLDTLNGTFTGTLHFRNLAPQKVPMAGDIIASWPTPVAPYGFLYRIVNVSTDVNGVTTAEVKNAALEEAIEEVNFQIEVPLDFGEDGLEKSASERTIGTLGFSGGVNFPENLGSASARARYNMYLVYVFDCEMFDVNYVKLALRQTIGAELSVTIDKTASGTLSGDLYRTDYLPPITFAVAGIPITITNELYAQAKVNLGSQRRDTDIMASFELNATAEFGFEYRKRGGFNKLDSIYLSASIGVDHEFSGEATAGIMVGWNPRFNDYGVKAGIEVYGGPSIKLSAPAMDGVSRLIGDRVDVVLPNGLDGVTAQARLDFGIEYGAKARLNIISWDILNDWSYGFDGWKRVRTLATASMLPRFQNQEVSFWSSFSEGENLRFSAEMQRSLLGYTITGYGVCVEALGGDQCVNGGGMRWFDTLSGYSGNNLWQFRYDTEGSDGGPPPIRFFGSNPSNVGTRPQFPTADLIPGTVYAFRPYVETYLRRFWDTPVEYEYSPTRTLTVSPFTSWGDRNTLIGSVVINGADTLTGAGTRNYLLGSQITATAVPGTGYKFDGWGHSGIDNMTNPVTFTIDENRSLNPQFNPIPCTLTTRVTPNGGGTLTGVYPNPYTGHYWDTVTVTATPARGGTAGNYVFAGWSGAATGYENPLKLVIKGNQELVAHFVFESETYTLDIVSDGGGVVKRDPDQASYARGTRVELTAIPPEGKVFTEWTGWPEWSAHAGSRITANPVTVTMNGDMALTATFRTAYTLTTGANPAVGGTVTRSPEQPNYGDGTLVTVSAVAAEGYVFTGWSGAATSTDPTISFRMDGNKTLTANFSQPFTLTTSAVPTAGGTVSRSLDGPNYTAGTQVSVTAEAAAGYTFTGWSGAATGTVNQLTITMDGNKALTANFSLNAYTLSISAGTGGTVSPTGTSTHNHGASVSVTATADAGYTFTGWTGTGAPTPATMNPAVVVMTGDRTLTANFQSTAPPPDDGTFTDTRDGQVYRTVTIGGYTWMAENLNYQTDSSWCYNNDPSNCNTSGRLYNWDAAMTACPVGWSLPEAFHWDALARGAGGVYRDAGSWDVADRLKSATGWGDTDTGIDEFGFSALPGGQRVRVTGGVRFVSGTNGYWWTSTGITSDPAYAQTRQIVPGTNAHEHGYYGNLYTSGGNKVGQANSVRCIKD